MLTRLGAAVLSAFALASTPSVAETLTREADLAIDLREGESTDLVAITNIMMAEASFQTASNARDTVSDALDQFALAVPDAGTPLFTEPDLWASRDAVEDFAWVIATAATDDITTGSLKTFHERLPSEPNPDEIPLGEASPGEPVDGRP
jgi:hypothetical protein